MNATDNNNAANQAAAQYESIVEMVQALELDWDRLDELRDMDADDMDADERAELAELNAAAGDCEDRDAARERIENDALSVQVRTTWHTPGDADGAKPDEFMILLCTGGPAARIRGELNEYGEPDRAWLEYQDWFTPWSEYTDADADYLLAYAQCFYFIF